MYILSISIYRRKAPIDWLVKCEFSQTSLVTSSNSSKGTFRDDAREFSNNINKKTAKGLRVSETGRRKQLLSL